MKLYQRHLFSQLSKFFFFFLFLICLSIVLIDFAIHSHLFFDANISYGQLFVYYLYKCLQNFFLLIPFTLILTTCLILFEKNLHLELLALFSAGFTKFKIALPFFLFSLLLSLSLFLIDELIIEKGSAYIENFKPIFAKQIHTKKPKIHSVMYDNTQLIFHSYDQKSKTLEDIFWIETNDKIWHMEKLFLENEPQGTYVDLLEKKEGVLTKTHSYPTLSFSKLELLNHTILQSLISFENAPILGLFSLIKKNTFTAHKKAQFLTQINYRLSIILLPFLVIFSLIPYCFTHKISFFWILLFSLFSLITFFLVLQSMIFLAKNQVLSPYIAIWGSFIFFMTLFSKNYLKGFFK